MDRLADRLPPQDLEAEQATLGAMLIDPGAVVRAIAIVETEDFYREAHRTIYTAMLAVHNSGEPVDVVTVGAELSRLGKLATSGGSEYLNALIGEVPTSAHVIRYASIVAETGLLRRLIRLGADLQRAAYEHPDDPNGLLDEHMRAVTALRQGIVDRGAVLVGDRSTETLRRLEASMQSVPGVSAARTGIPELDRAMGGFAGHTLVVARGVEKAGKSMFGMQCLLSSALAFREEGAGRCAVAYVLEGQEIWEERALAWLGEFNSDVFRPTVSVVEHERVAFNRAAQMWQNLPLFVSGALSDLDGIIADVRRIHMRHQVGFVLVDYAQLIQGGNGGSNVEKNEDKANRLAALAAEIRAPVLVPSQITKGEGGWQSKWSRGWDEAASLVFNVERGEAGRNREDWQRASEGRVRLHGCRRRPPFVIHDLVFNLKTGRITDSPYQQRRDGDE